MRQDTRIVPHPLPLSNLRIKTSITVVSDSGITSDLKCPAAVIIVRRVMSGLPRPDQIRQLPGHCSASYCYNHMDQQRTHMGTRGPQ